MNVSVCVCVCVVEFVGEFVRKSERWTYSFFLGTSKEGRDLKTELTVKRVIRNMWKQRLG